MARMPDTSSSTRKTQLKPPLETNGVAVKAILVARSSSASDPFHRAGITPGSVLGTVDGHSAFLLNW